MSNIKYSNNVFLGRYELVQLQNFLQDEGYQKFIKDTAIQYGLINNSTEGNFTNALVEEGTGNNTIKYSEIKGIDTDGKFIYSAASGDVAVGTSGADTAWYWVKLVRAESNLESGTISISTDGALTGVSTDFLTSMRGVATDLPTKVNFPSATLNTGEYEVLSVTDDTTAALNVVGMSAEAALDWRVIPTTTPGAVLTTDEKELFNYDSATVSLVAESALTLVDGLPTAVDGEYWIARVQNSGTDVIVQDKRSNYIFETVDGYFTSYVDRSTNACVGVEGVKFAALSDPRDKNIVDIAFGFRSSNWTSNSTVNRVTLIGGNGGKFKDTTYFADGDFDGWRLYYETGKYALIKQSTLSGTQINLSLDSLDVTELSDTTQQLLVVPDASEVEIHLEAVSTTPMPTVKRVYSANTDVCRIEVPVTSTTSNYTVKYKHKHIKDYSALLTIPDDAIGYYNESSYNDDGSLKALMDRVSVPIVLGAITLNRSINAYANRIANVESGDLFGVRTLELDASIINNELIVGTNKKEQIFTSDGEVTLTANKYINLKTANAVEGNQFFLTFKSDIVLDGNDFLILDEWDGVSVITPEQTLLTFDEFYLFQSKNNDLLLRCTFDGINWEMTALTATNSVDTNILADEAVTLAKMDVNSVDSDQYVNGSIDAIHLASNSVTNSKISSSAVDTAELADASVTAAKLAADVLPQYGTFTPTITFSGGGVGLAYSTQDGIYTITELSNGSSLVWFSIHIVLTSKGSSTGDLVVAPAIGFPSTNTPLSCIIKNTTLSRTATAEYQTSTNTIRFFDGSKDPADPITNTEMHDDSIISISGSFID